MCCFDFHDFLSDFAVVVGVGGFFVFSTVVGLDVADFGVADALDLNKIAFIFRDIDSINGWMIGCCKEKYEM